MYEHASDWCSGHGQLADQCGSRGKTQVSLGQEVPFPTEPSSSLQVTSLKPKPQVGEDRLPLPIPEGSEKQKTLPGTF